ncbi:PilZ domain-containing protein [Fodinisporobacter ferrooxydans]|uniref:PilZ domain-containing protein n=1 Tax=Fodinisporobacter ferrooxydans TaxID=2901836 RepID=A0ABY4CEV7_9BACL|nr:PilZ domain-containing protein [Alicyclobacillaceae bacterium MYW30-H2]
MFALFTKNKKEENLQPMQLSNRENNFSNQREYFRLPMDKKCSIQLKIGNLTSSWGECHLVNVSAGGAQIMAPYKFPVSHSDILVRIQFDLVNQYTLESEIVWSNLVNNVYHYGLKWVINDLNRENMEQELIHFQIINRKGYGVH